MNYTIEKATSNDIKTIKRLLKHAGLDTSDVRWRNFFVAKNGHEIMGCIQLKQYPGVKELASLLVRKKYRGQSIGRALVSHLLTTIEKQIEKPPVYLICPQNRQSFYEQCGFYVVPNQTNLPLILLLRYTIGRFLGWRLFKTRLLAMRWDGDEHI